MDPYSLSSYQYELPEELIAQHPCEPRDSSRLMIINRSNGTISEMPFYALTDFLQADDQLIFNDTRVVPARLLGYRPSGGKTEVFLTKRNENGSWNALVRPGRKLPPGTSVIFNPQLSCQITAILPNGERQLRFSHQGDLDQLLENAGQIPLPHYMKREAGEEDHKHYQTVYAKHPGALAAPTAGLHFSEQMLQKLELKGISTTKITLHTGLGTFRSVKTEDIRSHDMHSERYLITKEAAERLNAPLRFGQRQICVGTTCCRTLESASDEKGQICEGESDTNIFIYPGYHFRYVKSLLTNFHLPGSTLLMLVCAFAGRDLIMEAYTKAIKERFRFFSYGDAMLIL